MQNYHEHAIGGGEDATAVAYVQLRIGSDRTVYGVGLDANIVTATLRAVVSAVNRALQRDWLALQPVEKRRERLAACDARSGRRRPSASRRHCRRPSASALPTSRCGPRASASKRCRRR